MLKRSLSLFAACALSACTAPDPERAVNAEDAALWTFMGASAELMAASCPEDTAHKTAQTISIGFIPMDLSGVESAYPLEGWALASDASDFGGLSGLAIMTSGTLLAVSDKGAFVWIAMEDGAPATSSDEGTGRAFFAPMLDAAGAPLNGKARGDAEGLAFKDGLALVSFEREHRILAFDLEGCGANARGAPVATIAERPQGMSRSMRQNGGLEGLALLPDGSLAAAIETRDPAIPFGRVRTDGSLVIDGAIETFEGKAGTGIDAAGDTLFTIHRDYRPGDGTHITVSATPLSGGVPAGSAEPLLSLDPQDPVDNFEAIAASVGDDGKARRLYLLSDDNFSDQQRTLLFALDLETP
ncbi:MAG: esterase-like activity of phytase family protein [Pseudomonadota bacterium]